jgi:hypothetical protein
MLIEMPNRPSVGIGCCAKEAEPFPADVEMILSAMEAGRHAWSQGLENTAATRAEGGGSEERRVGDRFSYRVRAELRLFRDQPGSPAWLLYVRDADTRGLGFISQYRLPLGYGGYVELVAPTGRPLSIPCTLFRCREAVPGWYEGAMNFNREQEDFKL